MTTFSIVYCKDCETKYYLIMCQDCDKFYCKACFWKCNYCNENPNEILDDIDLESGDLHNYTRAADDGGSESDSEYNDLQQHELQERNDVPPASINVASEIMNSISAALHINDFGFRFGFGLPNPPFPEEDGDNLV
jgi:hypothetical protein